MKQQGILCGSIQLLKPVAVSLRLSPPSHHWFWARRVTCASSLRTSEINKCKTWSQCFSLVFFIFFVVNFLSCVIVSTDSSHLGCGWWIWRMDWSWWLVNLRPSTSRTISISFTLQAHPLIRMKKVTCWLSTFHLQSIVQRALVMVTLCTSLLCCYTATTCPEAKLTLLHTVGELVLHQQHPGSFTTCAAALIAVALPASEVPQVMMFEWASLKDLATPLAPQRAHTREATYGRLRWIPLLFQRNLSGLRGDRSFTLLFTRLSLIISQ